MRTTLDIDEDLLRAAPELARRHGVSTGKVVSRLMRAALLARPGTQQAADLSVGASRTGFVPLEPGKAIVTERSTGCARPRGV